MRRTRAASGRPFSCGLCLCVVRLTQALYYPLRVVVAVPSVLQAGRSESASRVTSNELCAVLRRFPAAGAIEPELSDSDRHALQLATSGLSPPTAPAASSPTPHALCTRAQAHVDISGVVASGFFFFFFFGATELADHGITSRLGPRVGNGERKFALPCLAPTPRGKGGALPGPRPR
jgi:hypothetical protein